MKTPVAIGVGGIAVACLATVGVVAFFWGAGPSAVSVKTPPVAERDRSSDARAVTIAKPPRPDEGYVGSQVCAGCHPQIAQRYEHTAMGRSLAKIAESTAPHEDYETRTSFEVGNLTYRVERKGDRVWHHEILSDGEGPIYDQSEEVQYAMGSNARGRSYMLWRDGLMYVSPIAWFMDGGWDLAPGISPSNNPRFARRAEDSCLICHCGRVVTEESHPHYFPQPIFYEIAIGCERCHGPGHAHVEHRTQSATGENDPILRLGDLPASERNAVCNQCHFQGESRIPRYGRAESDFRPGMKLSDVWTTFIQGNGVDGGEMSIVSQAMQMESSRCYQASDGRMGCVSCHDPHDSFVRDRTGHSANQGCLNCHADRGCTETPAIQNQAPANGSCIVCHMPPRRAKDVAHTSLTDHRVLRRPENRVGSSNVPGWAIFEDGGAKLPDAEQARAMGLLLVRNMSGELDLRVGEECERLLLFARLSMPDDQDILLGIADLYAKFGRTSNAEAIWKQWLEQHPRDEWSLLSLSKSVHNAGRDEEADYLFKRCMEVNSWQPMAHFRWASSLSRLGKIDDAITEAKRALALDPTLLPIYFWLADAYANRGDREQSEHFKRLGDRLSKSANSKKL